MMLTRDRQGSEIVTGGVNLCETMTANLMPSILQVSVSTVCRWRTTKRFNAASVSSDS